MNIIPIDSKVINIISDYLPRRIKEKIVLVLNGGALFGPYQFGWLYRLWELRILHLIDLIITTSVGALNGGLVAKFLDDMDAAMSVWLTVKKKENVYDRDLNAPTVVWQAAWGSQSILDPKGLYAMLEKEFGADIDLKIDLITTATNLGESDCDGGVGDNCPVDDALELGATKVIILGTSPNVPKERMKRYLFKKGKANIKKGLIKSSAIPVVFPTDADDGKKIKMIDVVKALLPAVMDVFEEHVWKSKYWRDKLTEANPKMYPPVEWLEGFPSKAIPHDSLDCTHVEEDIELGYKEACEYLTPERLEAFFIA
jgi:hypothetical protein